MDMRKLFSFASDKCLISMNAIGLSFSHQIFFNEILELIIIVCFELEVLFLSPIVNEIQIIFVQQAKKKS